MEETGKASKNIKIIVINIHGTLFMSQALFKSFTCLNSFNAPYNLLEVSTGIIPILKMKKLSHRAHQ